MRRLAILIFILTSLSIVGSLGFIRAFSDAGHPFATTWCDSPVVISLANEGIDGVVTPAEGVSVARGADVGVGTRGPGIRLNELGSRAQVDLGQTLFHTQWLFSSVDSGDAIRVDAIIGDASQPVPASSIRGSLTPAVEQLEVGVLAEADTDPATTGEIDLFTGSTSVMFTNEGESPVHVIAAIGCPAIELETEQLSAPTWDPDTQQFVAEHVVRFHNQLANSRVRALRSADPSVISYVVDNLNLDLSLAAPGFTTAELIDISGSTQVTPRISETYDGSFETVVLDDPLRLADTAVEELTFTVGYVPNFDDPAWEDGVDVPAPQLSIWGRVDSIQVGLSAELHSLGASVDRSLSPRLLDTPEPGLVLDFDNVEEPTLASDGRIELDHQITVTNNGETTVEDLVVDYPLVEMFGPGTVVESVEATTSRACEAPVSEAYDGGIGSMLLFDSQGIPVGQSCTIYVSTRVIAGEQVTSTGSTYDAPITVSAQSGARVVRDVASMRVTLRQNVAVDVDVVTTEVTNLEDGRYQVDGTIAVQNEGELNLGATTIAFDVSRPSSIVETDTDGEQLETAVDGKEPAPVFFFDFVGDDRCSTGAAPGGANASVFVSGEIALDAGTSCEVDFSFIAIPGRSIEGWSVDARIAAPLTSVQPEIAEHGTDSFNFSESPAIEASSEIESITNNGNGTYSVRSNLTVSNVGDVPLVEVAIEDDVESAFASQLISHERVGDSCSLVSGASPLPTSLISPDTNTCVVTHVSLIEPGADLAGDKLNIEASAISTSGSGVDSSVVSEQIEFDESPEISPELIVESVERLDTETVALVLAGSVTNTGDVDARNVQIELDLDQSFDNDGVDYSVQFVSVQGLTGSESFDGSSETELLVGTETIVVDGRVDFRALVHLTPGDASGPYDFDVVTTATSPASADFDETTASDQTAIPMVVLTTRTLESENNNDGTYSIISRVVAENAGVDSLAAIQLFTDFEQTFGGIALGVVDVSSTCGSQVDAGAQCSLTQRATVRPGSAVGPYDVIVNVAAFDDSQVSALVLEEELDEAESSTDPLLFSESPGIEVEAIVGAPRNNNDGTYDVTYFAEVTNTGDVPLYRVGLNNYIDETFGDRVVSDAISSDECNAISFAQPLAPGFACEQTRTITVRPLSNLGPWTSSLDVTADTPSAALLDADAQFDSITFAERVAISAESELAAGTNNGDGSYVPTWAALITNTGDVPVIDVSVSDPAAGYRIDSSRSEAVADSCALVTPTEPLAPGAQCEIQQNHYVSPGSVLGPFELDVDVTATSPSTATVTEATTSNAMTLLEDPELELSTVVTSVEGGEEQTYRVVQDLVVTNAGDVRVDDLTLSLDLDQVFGEIPFRLDGVVSNDFVISEAFAGGESNNIVAAGQSLQVGSQGTITVVLTIEPGSEVGPFTGDLRAAGTSPAGASVAAAIDAQLDLPSVAVQIVAQSVENNRDGSYTVTSSYEITNDGTTALEFVRLDEDLAAIYEGASARLVAVSGGSLDAADLDDLQRGANLIAWGAGLESGATSVVTSTVIVEPGNNLGPFNSAVTVQAASPTGTLVNAQAVASDVIEFDEQPALRVAQSLANRPEWTGDRFEVTFSIEVINGGDVELRGLQVREDLLNALGAESRIFVRDIRSEDFTVNSRFDGLGQYPSDGESTASNDIGDTRLLGGLDTLAAGTSGTIELDLVIVPETRGVFSPRVVVSARTPAGADLGTGDEQIEASTLTRLSVQGELGVAKRVVGDPEVQPDGRVAVTYEILVENA